MIAYAGTYHVQDNEIIIHAEVSWSQTLGTDSKRSFKLEDNRLTITTMPEANPFLNNQITVATLVWEWVK